MLAYNIKRAVALLGTTKLAAAMQALAVTLASYPTIFAGQTFSHSLHQN